MEAEYYGDIGLLNAILREVNNDVKFKTTEAFRRFSRSVIRDSKTKKYVKEAHKELVEKARQATLEAFEKETSHKPPYRGKDPHWPRFAGGRMRRGIINPRFINSDEKGIYFGNVTYMDKQAAQWMRLNFGAEGGRGGVKQKRPPGYGSMKFFNRTVSKRLTLERFGPSEPFYIPGNAFFSPQFIGGAGVFVKKVDRGRPPYTDAMYLDTKMKSNPFNRKIDRLRPHRKQLSRGIVGFRYLDAGVRVINEGYGPAITNIANTYFRDGIKKMKE